MNQVSSFGSSVALRPPQPPGLGRGFVFALLAHGLLLLALSAGVQWHSQTTPAFEAELWSAVPQAAAPKAEEPPEPPPQPAPQQRAAATQAAEEAQAQRDAEIAIAKAREEKRKLEEQQRLAEERRKRELAQKAADEQARKDKALKDKLAREKAEKEQQAERLAEKKREAQRQEYLKRIQGLAGATGAANATGSALRDSAPSSGYGGRIKAKIRPNIIYTDGGAGNPVAEVEVRAAPDGTIIARKLLKSSGDPEWDKAVLRAIDKTEMLPRDVDGRVPSLLVISFQPKD